MGLISPEEDLDVMVTQPQPLPKSIHLQDTWWADGAPGTPQSESQASCSVVASTAEARLSSWPFSLSPGGREDRQG